MPAHCKTHTEHINILCGQNVVLVLNLAVCILTTELQNVGKATGCGMNDCGSNTGQMKDCGSNTGQMNDCGSNTGQMKDYGSNTGQMNDCGSNTGQMNDCGSNTGQMLFFL